MKSYSHWILLAIYTGLIFKPTLTWANNLPEATLADWANVWVSLLSAILLFGTLITASRSNLLISKQLRANRPFLLCESIQYNTTPYKEQVAKYRFKITTNWQNYGNPPALSAKFTYRFKSHINENIPVSDLLDSVMDKAGKTIPSELRDSDNFALELTISNDKNGCLEFTPSVLSSYVIFRDAHGSTYIIEKCYEPYLTIPAIPGAAQFIKFRAIGPDNKETTIDSN